MKVTNAIELKDAIKNNEERIEIVNSINIPEGIKLSENQKLVSSSEGVLLSFINGDGIALSGNNEITGVNIQTAPNKRAIYIESTSKDLGEIKLQDLKVNGVVQLITRDPNESLNLNLKNIDIISADARTFSEKPMKYGVVVYQGALTGI